MLFSRVTFCCGASFVALDVAAFAQDLLWEIKAASSTDLLGWATLGPDVDGDGLPELLLSYIEETCGAGTTGVVRIVSTASGEISSWCGPTLGGYFGNLSAWLDDVDGLGTADIIIGEQYYRDPFWGSQTGRVQVYSTETQSLLYEIIGTMAYGRFGLAAVCEDLDGDGLRDFVVGATGYGGNGEGQAWVFSGKSGAEIRRHVGTKSDQGLGWWVLGIGDADGDGSGDYVISMGSGGFDVHSGATGSVMFRNDPVVTGNSGTCIARAADLDGDSLPDLLSSQVFPGGDGYVDAWSPIQGAILWTVKGLASNEYFGKRVVEVGDQNGDGVRDFLMAALNDDHDSRDSGRTDLISGATLRRLYRFYPNTTKARYWGEIMTLGADFNGDGIEDLILGTTDGGKLSNDAGMVQILAGNDLWLQADPIDPLVGETITVDLRGAVPGVLGLIALIDIDGTPTFDSLLLTTFDGNGEMQFTADADPSVAGMDFTMVAYAQDGPGRGPLRDSAKVVVQVQ